MPPPATSVDLGAPHTSLLSIAAGDAGLDQGVILVFDGGGATPTLAWHLPADLDWSDAGAFGLTVENHTLADVQIWVTILADGGPDAGFSVSEYEPLAPGATQMFAFTFTDPTALGMQTSPPYAGCIPAFRLDDAPIAFGGNLGAVTEIRLPFYSDPDSGVVIVGAPALWSAPESFTGIIDAFGQYSGRDWPGKASSVQDLQAQAAAEAPSLALDGGGPGLDAYGGTTLVAAHTATGFFRVEQTSDGGFWLVDPLGNLFFSIGLDHVGQPDQTNVGDRASMFLALPDGGPFLHGSTDFDFYSADGALKYGVPNPTPTLEDIALRRLWAWGFNTVGAFSTDDYLPDSGLSFSTRVPYTIWVSNSGTYAKLSVAGKNMPDPYDPAFATSFAAKLGALNPSAITDPYLLGYFIDNELPWRPAADTGVAPFALSYAVFATDASATAAYAKQAFLAALQREYPTIAALNTAWGTSYASFSMLSPPLALPTTLAGLTTAAQGDLNALTLAFAEQYYRTVQSALRTFDPHHLYLGSKFSYYTPQVIEACAEYADVLSFDNYDFQLGNYAFLNAFPKPALVGEYNFTAGDRGMFWGNVGSQAERGTDYAAFLRSVIANPQFVGAHWFEYWDEPTAGRLGDGENYNTGFVAVDDAPYPELVAAAQVANAAVYASRLGL